MMKTILLLTFAVFVSSASLNSDKHLLGELIGELREAIRTLPKEPKGNEIFLKELIPVNDDSENVFLCQAEQELVKRVSGLTKFDHFRTDKKLMRNLHEYNKHNRSTCEPVDEDQVEIPLHKFLENLKQCVQKAYSKKN